MKVYVVTMYKYSEKSNYSYLLGVYTDKKLSIKEGGREKIRRGNKYDPEIIETELVFACPEGMKRKTIVGLDYE